MSLSKVCLSSLVGGNFLLVETDSNAIFTPEDISSDQRMMADTAARFMDKEVLPNIEALEQQDEGVTPRLFQMAGELGLLGMDVPPEFGGLGVGKTSLLGVEEQFTRLGGFGVTCGAHSGIGTLPLLYFGTEAQKEKYLSKLASGEWMGAYALTETGSGSDALAMRTRATLSADGTHYLLNGTKMWISNTAWAELFTVFAKVDGEHVTAFLVERGFPGVSFGKEEHKLGIKSSSTRRVTLEDARVPVENLLGGIGKGAYIAFNILNAGRFKLGAGALGAARESIKGAARYAMERQQFGRPLAGFGLIQEKLGEMAVRLFAGESAVYRTAGMMEAVFETGELVDSTTPPFPRGLEEFALECSIIKVSCSEILDDVADEALQIHGGYGYTEEFPPARVCRDSRINRIFEGTNEINRLFIPGLLLRRAQRGRLALVEAISRVEGELREISARPSDFEHRGSAGSGGVGSDLGQARSLVENAKRLVLHLFGLIHKKYGEKFSEEQEVVAILSDMIIDIYLAESALLRTAKALGRGKSAGVMSDLAMAFVNDAAGRWEGLARKAFAVISEGDQLSQHLATLRSLMRWTPLNGVSIRRRIANRLCEVGSYPALVCLK